MDNKLGFRLDLVQQPGLMNYKFHQSVNTKFFRSTKNISPDLEDNSDIS